MPDKTATHNGLTCVFTEADHSYRIKETGDLLTSVTTLIKKYTPQFNAVKMAQRMVDKKNAKYVGMTVEEIIKQWEEKAEMASIEGTLLHSYAEEWPKTKGWGFNPLYYRVLLMTKQVDRLFPKLLNRFKVVESEKLVFSAELGLAGQIDLLMADEKTNEGIILDWKTNSRITDEDSGFGYMLEPIDHLKNCDVVKYGLQLGLYEKMLAEEGYYSEFNGYRKALIHIKEMFGKVVKVKDYAEEIECLTL
jgi:ATP-dependent exoDNAse (exonuclease V) beta subunit